jgi:hypothetical protein
MLHKEIIYVCSEIRTKHINTVRGQNEELLNVKPGGTYSDHWGLKGYRHIYFFSEYQDTAYMMRRFTACKYKLLIWYDF